MLWFRVPPKIYYKYRCLGIALKELTSLGKKKAFFDVEPDPTLATAKKGALEMATFKPDVIIAVGGGSPMDAAKIMWVIYEHPEVRFEDLAMRFMYIRKRVYTFPKMGEKAMMISIPTSAGTGSEVTPFAVITDEKTGIKYPLADYEITANIAIIDAELMCESAFDDHCTGTNPRYPLICEIKQMYINAYEGTPGKTSDICGEDY